MKYILNLLLATIITSSFAQPLSGPKISGTIYSIYSNILKEKRTIFVYAPSSATTSKCPVVYLLDPEGHFNTATEMIKELAVKGVLPEMIVVGITNTDRTRDLTPTHVGKELYHDKAMGWNLEAMKTSGGAENFTAFIEKELIPHIDSLYSTAPYRILIGHSFGGLMATNTLLNHSDLFNAYIVIDPSLWWDNQKLFKQVEKEFVNKKLDGKTVYMAVANVKPINMNVAQVRKDTAVTTVHMRTNLQLNDFLTLNKQNNLRYSGKYYNDDDHGSVPIIATYDGLRFIFNQFKPHLPGNTKNTNVDSVLTLHFNNLSKAMGYTVHPPLVLVNDYGYQFLSLKNYKQAYKLFQKNVDNYPNSYYVYDGMGDYYNEIGEKEKAIEFYKKAISIFDFPESKAKLKKLLEEK